MKGVSDAHAARMKAVLSSMRQLCDELSKRVDDPAFDAEQLRDEWDYVAHDVNEFERVLEVLA